MNRHWVIRQAETSGENKDLSTSHPCLTRGRLLSKACPNWLLPQDMIRVLGQDAPDVRHQVISAVHRAPASILTGYIIHGDVRILPRTVRSVYSTMEDMASVGFFIAVATYLIGLAVVTFWQLNLDIGSRGFPPFCVGLEDV